MLINFVVLFDEIEVRRPLVGSSAVGLYDSNIARQYCH